MKINGYFKKFVKRFFALFLCIIISGLSIAGTSGKVYASSTTFLSDEVIDKFVNMLYKTESLTASKVKGILSGKEKGTYEEFKDIYTDISTVYGFASAPFVEAASLETLDDISFLNNIIGGCIKIYDNAPTLFSDSANAIQKAVDGFQVLEGAMKALGCGAYFPSGLSLVLTATDIAIDIGGFLEEQYYKEKVVFYDYKLSMEYYSGKELTLPNAPSVLGFKLTQEDADNLYAQTYAKYYIRQMMDRIGEPVSDGSGNTGNSITGGIVFEQQSYSIAINEIFQFTSKYYSSTEQTDITITYTSSNTSIFTVTTDGLVTPVGEGTAKLIATASNGATATCEIIVYIPKIYIEKINLPKESIELAMNMQVTMTAGYSPSDANTDTEIMYSSSDESVFTVDSFGKVTPVGEGTANFIATSDNGVQGTCEIKVYPYNVSENETGYTIDKYLGSATEISIISSINGVDITCLGSKSFYNLDNISSIDIPNTVKNIGESVFEDCDNLTIITIPDGVISIGARAFKGCEKIATIKLPKSLKKIDEDAFYFCFGLTSVYISDITSWCNMEFVSASANPLCYADFLYIDNKLVTDVSIPNGITNIGDYAFYNCTKLISINIPSSVESIGDYAFSGCTNLKSIIIPSSVESIGDYAFNECDSIQSVSIPDSVIRIGDCAFLCCHSLTCIFVDENNPNYSSIDGVLYNKDKTTLFQYPIGKTDTEYTVQDSVTKVGAYAFGYCENLAEVKLPNSALTIGQYAFAYTGIKEVTLPKNVVSIGQYAFSECAYLRRVNYNVVNCRIGSSNFIVVTDSPFVGAYVTEVTIGEQVEAIPAHMFRNKNIIESVYIKDLKHWCSIDFGNSSANPLKYAENIYVNGELVTNLVIPENTETINKYAFYNFNGFDSVVVPETVTTIGDSAFYNCTNLKYVFYAGTQEQWSKIDLFSNAPNLNAAAVHYEATWHTYGDWNITSEVTCTENGTRTKTCSVCSDEVTETMVSSGHNYVVQSSDDNHPHTVVSECSFCNDTKEETQNVSDCYECIYGKEPPIKETPDTEIDYTNLVIRTSVESADELSDVLGVTENAIVTITPSYKYGNLELYGTGTVITVFDGNEYVGDFTLVVNGDTNGDSVCDALDAAQVANVSNGLKTIDGAYKIAADSNSDDIVDIEDYQAIVNKAVS